MSLYIYVSKDDLDSTNWLKQELNKDSNYAFVSLANVSVRDKFQPSVYCLDCGDFQCSVGGMGLGFNTPIVKCDNCGHVYHDNKTH